MSTMRFSVSVTLRRTPVANRWISERWEPIAVDVEAGAPAPVPTKVADDAGGTCWRFGGHSVELHRSEAEGYHLNVTSPEPKVFVMWRTDDEPGAEPPVRPVIVTLSYNQAARMLDGGERVDAVPMPPALLAWMLPFVEAHYKPEPRKKVRRNDPFRDERERRDRGPRH